jgi:Protein of unknown function (DUF3987)
LGGIQPGPLMDYMGTVPDDGLVQRFQLLVWPDSSKDWRDVDRWPDTGAKNAAYDIFTRLLTLTPPTCGASLDDSGIPYLRYAPKAQELFSEWRAELEHRLRGDALPPAIESHLAKYRSLVPTLALLIHLADVGHGPVELEPLERACAWSEYLESHAQRIYSPAIAPDHIGAKALATHILKGELSDRFTLRDVYNHHWSNLADQDRAYKAVCVLVEFDWLRSEQETTGGRPRTWYFVNPRLKEVDYE